MIASITEEGGVKVARESAMNANAATNAPGKPLTGLKVLAWVVGFFGIVFAANGIMIHYAVSTFRGLDEKNPYTTGLTYNDQIAAEKAQDQRGWKVDFTVRRLVGGQSEIAIQQQDRAGAATAALKVLAYFEHPADRNRDLSVPVEDFGGGVFRHKLEIAPGAWDLVIEMQQGGEQVFRSRNRVMIADAPAG